MKKYLRSAVVLVIAGTGVFLAWSHWHRAPAPQVPAPQTMTGAFNTLPGIMASQQLPEAAAPAAAPKPQYRTLEVGKRRLSPMSSAWTYERETFGGGFSATQLYSQLASKKTLDESDSASVSRLAKALSVCRYQINLREQADNAAANDNTSDEKRLRTDAQAYDGICKDLPKEAFDRSDRWVAQLAAAGDERAMAIFASGEGIDFGLDPADVTRDPQRFAEHKQQTMRYLDIMIERGYAPALVRMAMLYNGAWFETDRVKEFAYDYAYAKAKGDSEYEKKLQAKLQAVLPPERQVEAQKFAQEVYAKCCNQH